MFLRLICNNSERMAAHGVTLEDLLQEGYFAIMQAVDGYDPAAGANFATYLRYPVMSVFFSAVGMRTKRQRKDILSGCRSLDEPLTDEEGEDRSLADAVADPAAEAELAHSEDGAWVQQLHATLDACLDELTPREAGSLRGKYYGGKTLAQLAQQYGVNGSLIAAEQRKALRLMRYPQRLRRLEEFRSGMAERMAYTGTGFTFWKERGSVEERAVEKIDKAEREEANLFGLSVEEFRGLSV